MWIDLPNIQILLDDLNSSNFDGLKRECMAGIHHVAKYANDRYSDVMDMGSSPQNDRFKIKLKASKENISTEVLKKTKHFCEKNSQILRFVDYHYGLGNNFDFYLDRLWVNYQKSTEFFPAHPHSAFMTFVIFVNIPYIIDKSLDDANSSDIPDSAVGSFEFFYTDIIGNHCTYRIPADTNYEGKILMFPGNMVHTVYPYYGDDWRITVSGNIRIKKNDK
jgi:hypothetical protein